MGLAAVLVSGASWGNVSPNQAFLKANEYANMALKIDNTIAGAYDALGVINIFYFWNWKEAERNFKHAIKLNPNSSMFLLFYSFLLIITGRHEEAISQAKQAQELDPLSAYLIHIQVGTFI